MAYQGVILDIDGTLVISNDAHAQAWVEAFAAFGYEVEFKQVRPLIGMGGDQIIPKFAPGLSDQEGKGKEIANKRKELVINKFGANLTPASGARQLILKMQDEELRLIIASSATSQELSVLLKAAQVDDLLSQDEAATSSDAEASKPAPDIVEAALSQLKMQASEVVMLGDTPYDIESANKAGVGVIAFRCGGFDDSQLKDAIAIYNDPADLLAHYDTSPLATKAMTSN
ncbi:MULTISPECIES: HAD family hydrolase [unclassified Nostoc]|uniref:HAD family hydrolase n=1 Tax=unclassified Nostoc TaxID=2593658 RepID=UPI002AD2E596|nr:MULTISPECIES: HAD family hydrolase [unclassified Nostoc]MDZ8121674.1 HAD family hydrolase [Nostoc sp. CmiVER01]MDZ8228273.1 HAD family hydrolase [Nostoc sp. ChiVER01]